MAMCVMAVMAVAPCQCFSPGGNQITSPGRMSLIGPPQRWARPQPAVTINVWPSGWVCHAVRAPGSKVTQAPRARAGSAASKSGSTRTAPVNHSAGPLPEGWEPHRLISIVFLPTPVAGLPRLERSPYQSHAVHVALRKLRKLMQAIRQGGMRKLGDAFTILQNADRDGEVTAKVLTMRKMVN